VLNNCFGSIPKKILEEARGKERKNKITGEVGTEQGESDESSPLKEGV
jgi:hypothetical protein